MLEKTARFCIVLLLEITKMCMSVNFLLATYRLLGVYYSHRIVLFHTFILLSISLQCFDTVGWLGDRKGNRPVKSRVLIF